MTGAAKACVLFLFSKAVNANMIEDTARSVVVVVVVVAVVIVFFFFSRCVPWFGGLI